MRQLWQLWQLWQLYQRRQGTGGALVPLGSPFLGVPCGCPFWKSLSDVPFGCLFWMLFTDEFWKFPFDVPFGVHLRSSLLHINFRCAFRKSPSQAGGRRYRKRGGASTSPLAPSEIISGSIFWESVLDIPSGVPFGNPSPMFLLDCQCVYSI